MDRDALIRKSHPEGHDFDRQEFKPGTFDLRRAMEAFEKHHLLEVLTLTRWHKVRAASLLGIDRRTLYKKLKKYGLA